MIARAEVQTATVIYRQWVYGADNVGAVGVEEAAIAVGNFRHRPGFLSLSPNNPPI